MNPRNSTFRWPLNGICNGSNVSYTYKVYECKVGNYIVEQGTATSQEYRPGDSPCAGCNPNRVDITDANGNFQYGCAVQDIKKRQRDTNCGRANRLDPDNTVDSCRSDYYNSCQPGYSTCQQCQDTAGDTFCSPREYYGFC